MCQYVDTHAMPDHFVWADLPCFVAFSFKWRYNLVGVSTLTNDDPIVFHPGRTSVCGLGLCSHLRRLDLSPAGIPARSTRVFSCLAGDNVQSSEDYKVFLARFSCLLIQSIAGVGTPADVLDASLIPDSLSLIIGLGTWFCPLARKWILEHRSIDLYAPTSVSASFS
jgi:hypothetical protein